MYVLSFPCVCIYTYINSFSLFDLINTILCPNVLFSAEAKEAGALQVLFQVLHLTHQLNQLSPFDIRSSVF